MDLVLPVDALPIYWDINKCPVPEDCDARRVGPCIKRYMRKRGYSGPIGKLSKVPEKILEAVSSTGISLYDVPYGRKDFLSLMIIYISRNRPPTKMVVISPPKYFVSLWSFEGEGRHIIFPFPSDSTKAQANTEWRNLLLEDPEDDKCSETVEPPIWVCGVCDGLAGRGFDNFMRHRSSEEHKRELFLDEQEKAGIFPTFDA